MDNEKINKIKEACDEHELEMIDTKSILFQVYDITETDFKKYSFVAAKPVTLCVLSIVFMIIGLIFSMNLIFWTSLIIVFITSGVSIHSVISFNSAKKAIDEKSLISYLRFKENKDKMSKELILNDYLRTDINFEEESEQFNIVSRIVIERYIEDGFDNISNEDFVKIKRIYKRNKDKPDHTLNNKIINYIRNSVISVDNDVVNELTISNS